MQEFEYVSSHLKPGRSEDIDIGDDVQHGKSSFDPEIPLLCGRLTAAHVN